VLTRGEGGTKRNGRARPGPLQSFWGKQGKGGISKNKNSIWRGLDAWGEGKSYVDERLPEREHSFAIHNEEENKKRGRT